MSLTSLPESALAGRLPPETIDDLRHLIESGVADIFIARGNPLHDQVPSHTLMGVGVITYTHRADGTQGWTINPTNR